MLGPLPALLRPPSAALMPPSPTEPTLLLFPLKPLPAKQASQASHTESHLTSQHATATMPTVC